jgi:pimeloyl-ACP methyl ester carboxylesterase
MGDKYDVALRRRVAAVRPDFPSRGPQRLALLVHGFWIGRDRSEAEFDRFRALLVDIAPRLHDDVRTFNWPGDSLKYWEMVKRAEGDVSGALAVFLAHAKTCGVQVVLIGHSLGCRVILEALSKLAANGHGDLVGRISVFLLAAAVPVSMVEHGHLGPVVSACQWSEAFHSDKDKALRHAFPRGEGVASGDWRREAVGLRGNPIAAWRREHKMQSFDHGHYWISPAVAYKIASALGDAQSKPAAVREERARAMGKRRLWLRRLRRRVEQLRR